jgi:hypothetical protein
MKSLLQTRELQIISIFLSFDNKYCGGSRKIMKDASEEWGSTCMRRRSAIRIWSVTWPLAPVRPLDSFPKNWCT